MRQVIVLLLVVLLPVLGGVAGRLSAPALSRAHPTVRSADLLRAKPDAPTLEEKDRIDAFAQGGRTKDQLFDAADAIGRRFATGATVLGVWCGLVFALTIFGFHRTRRRVIYEIDDAMCVACARCFMVCPRERLRREDGERGTHDATLTGAGP